MAPFGQNCTGSALSSEGSSRASMPESLFECRRPAQSRREANFFMCYNPRTMRVACYDINQDRWTYTTPQKAGLVCTIDDLPHWRENGTTCDPTPFAPTHEKSAHFKLLMLLRHGLSEYTGLTTTSNNGLCPVGGTTGESSSPTDTSSVRNIAVNQILKTASPACKRYQSINSTPGSSHLKKPAARSPSPYPRPESKRKVTTSMKNKASKIATAACLTSRARLSGICNNIKSGCTGETRSLRRKDLHELKMASFRLASAVKANEVMGDHWPEPEWPGDDVTDGEDRRSGPFESASVTTLRSRIRDIQ